MPTYTVGNGKTYATIQAAVDAIPDNLSGTGIHTVEVYAGGTQIGNGYFYDEEVDAVTGFINQSANDYIFLRAMISHNGLRDTGIIIRGVSDPVGADYSIVNLLSFSVIDGFGVKGKYYYNIGAATGIRFEAIAYMYTGFAYNCLVYEIHVVGLESSGCRGILLGCWGNTDEDPIANAEIINCAVFDLTANGFSYAWAFGININGSSDTWAKPTFVLNCSLNNFVGGADGGARGIHIENEINVHSIINNCVVGTCIGGTTTCYSTQIGSPSVEYCVSSDATADDWGGTGNQINKDPINDIKFVMATQGSEDLHIQTGSVCKDTGTDLSRYGFNDDWEGDTRPCFLAWDIGADELCFGETCCESCCCCKTKNFFNGR